MVSSMYWILNHSDLDVKVSGVIKLCDDQDGRSLLIVKNFSFFLKKINRTGRSLLKLFIQNQTLDLKNT